MLLSTSHKHLHQTDVRYHLKKWQCSKTTVHNYKWWINLISFIRCKQQDFKNNLSFYHMLGIPHWCMQERRNSSVVSFQSQSQITFSFLVLFWFCLLHKGRTTLVLLSSFCRFLADSLDLNALHISIVFYQYITSMRGLIVNVLSPFPSSLLLVEKTKTSQSLYFKQTVI